MSGMVFRAEKSPRWQLPSWPRKESREKAWVHTVIPEGRLALLYPKHTGPPTLCSPLPRNSFRNPPKNPFYRCISRGQ